ncbi:amidohydrolase family protein [Paenibacillus sp. NPDC057934]|uniref:amidohydrolase family protein n=1 Tax=Paenibacillus sp. NPDC057934 TaxID=3346282 RepID=UPI0036D9A1C8
MMIDGHSHVILPVESHIEWMNQAGVDKTILFSTLIHPEKANNAADIKKEMLVLDEILSGRRNTLIDARHQAIQELHQVVSQHPSRFIGFASIPVGLSLEDTLQHIEKITIPECCAGFGEFTLPSGGIGALTSVFEASRHLGGLPIWIHAFHPLVRSDIREIAELARRYHDVPVIIGHLGGVHWLHTIELVREIPNLYLDTSAYYSTLILKTAVNELPNKCLFGVDLPYGDLQLSIDAMRKVAKDRHIAEAVMGGNIATLLRL